jgi:hypothetical protein
MWNNEMGFEASALRIIFVPKKQEIAEAWRELNNEEINNFCSSPSKCAMKSRKMR